MARFGGVGAEVVDAASGAFTRMDHLGHDRETHGQPQSPFAQHGDLLHSDARARRGSAEIREEDAAGYAAGFLARPNLMTWSAAVYYTQVDPDTVMVRCTAPWFSWTCSAACTLPAALLQGLAGIRFRFAPGAPVMGEPSLSRGRATSEVLRGTSCSVSLIARLR
jgi:hypothetical protein